MATWLAVATAQGDLTDPKTRAEFEVGAFAVMSDVFGEDTSGDPRKRFMEAFDAAVAAMAGQRTDRTYPDDFEICGYLVGTGGNPRLDGGGSLLAMAPDFITTPYLPTALRSDYRIVPEATSAPTVIILDDFDIDSLLVSLSVRLKEGVISVDEVDGFQDLWRAFVGYVIDLDAVSDEEVSIRHGHLVAFHALARLPSRTVIWSVARSSGGGADRLVLTVQTGALPLFEVHLVDVDFNDLDTIGTAIRSASSPPEGSVHVMNLSWGLVDCALARAYDADGTASTVQPSLYDSLVAYLRAALGASVGFLDEVRGLCFELQPEIASRLGLAQPDDLDCTDHDVLASLGTAAVIADVSSRARKAIDVTVSDTATYFVAAGNQGLAFPMPPAGWPGFTGVEACTLGQAGLAEFSNVGSVVGPEGGTIRALGAWFEVDLMAIDESTGGALGPLGYWGTSFAAPTAAMNFAFGALNRGVGSLLAPCE